MIDRTNVLVFVFTMNPNLKVLLMKRTPEKGGFWQPISGGIDEGESPKDTLKRELREETSIEEFVRIIDLDYTFTHRTTKEGVLMNMRDICFAIEVEEETSIILSTEHLEYKWCNIEEVNHYLNWEPAHIAFQKLIKIAKYKDTMKDC